MLKGVIFDLDGTLLNTLCDLKEAVNFGLKKQGLDEISLAQTKSYIGNGVRKLCSRALKENHQDLLEDTLASFKEYYANNIANFTKPYEGIIKLLKSLKNKGYKIAIVSNKFQKGVDILSNLFFKDLIDFKIGGNDNIPLKPNPDMVNIALDNLKLQNNEILYVGDSDVDILTAKNSNLISVAVTWGFKDKDVLEKLNPDYLIDNPGEIINILKEKNND